MFVTIPEKSASIHTNEDSTKETMTKVGTILQMIKCVVLLSVFSKSDSGRWSGKSSIPLNAREDMVLVVPCVKGWSL